jgi:hypothetical protein
VIERELDTLRCAGSHGWLYVVWNATQPPPVELWIIQNPGEMSWSKVSDATTSEGRPRSARNEARYSIDDKTVEQAGAAVELSESIIEAARQLKFEAYRRGKIGKEPL